MMPAAAVLAFNPDDLLVRAVAVLTTSFFTGGGTTALKMLHRSACMV